MSDKTFSIKIDRVGRITMEGHGFTGSECMTKAKPILDALSDGSHEVTVKPEMHFIETETDQQEHLHY